MIKDVFLITLFFIACQTGFSQKKLRVLQSDSSSVSIKIDGNTVADWNIDPDTKPWTAPDVFAIDRSFKEKRVTYLSNRDSISFTVKPGGKYDFTIRIKNRGDFPMRLTTFGEPVFLHKKILISIFFVLIVTTWLSWSKRREIRLIALLWMGIISPMLFWLATIAGGFIHGNYSHLHDVVSELGAIGTRSEIFMSAAEILISILSVYSVVGFFKACKQIGLRVIPVMTILSLSVSMVWAAIFPLHHELHGALGPVPLFLNAGVLISIFLWKGKKMLTLRQASLVSFLLMLLILLRIVPNLRTNWEGLIQRFFYLGWSIWSIALGLIFIKMLKQKTGKPRLTV